MRVLLVGGYASGNLGDLGQRQALADEIATIRPEASIDAVAPGHRRTVASERGHSVLPSHVLKDHDVLNAYDVILVGGGGLLAAEWSPLDDEEWVGGITTRVCGVSLGAAAAPAEGARTFIERCDRFSVRDEYSAEAVGGMRPDVEITLDPALLTIPPEGNAPVARTGSSSVLCIPGRLLPSTRPFYEQVHERVLRGAAGSDVLSLHGSADAKSGFDDVFGSEVVYPRDDERVRERFSRHAYVISERYHGCILALRWQVPCFGVALRSAVVTSKITELYRRFDLSEHVLKRPEDVDARSLRRAGETFDFPRVLSMIGEERLRLRTYLESCLP